MATYAIGDVQGCFSALQCLLDKIHFDCNSDTLWFAGDLVNRGQQSLQTLRFVKSLGDAAVVVLGNHDLHLLAIAFGATQARNKDTVDQILQAEDRVELIQWLRQQKLCYLSADKQFVMSHAGIPPVWTVGQALNYAVEVESILQHDEITTYLSHMYGNQPDIWNAGLQGPERWRLITNYFTRMRFCDAQGKLELDCKLGPDQPPVGHLPWFHHPHKLNPQQKILFGHWAALEGQTNNPQMIALDTGCVWGGQLSAYRLEDQRWFHCSCQN